MGLVVRLHQVGIVSSMMAGLMTVPVNPRPLNEVVWQSSHAGFGPNAHAIRPPALLQADQFRHRPPSAGWL